MVENIKNMFRKIPWWKQLWYDWFGSWYMKKIKKSHVVGFDILEFKNNT